MSVKNLKEIARYIKGLGKILDYKIPAQLIYFVTNRCNSRCKTCFNWLNESQADELSLEEIEKISKTMGWLFWLFISGGEPFLRDDLPKICQIFYKNNKVNSIVIPTNGILSQKISQKTEDILRLCPKAKIIIQLSIDGIGQDHDQIRGVKGNFAKILETLKLLKRLQKNYKNLAIQANVVFCSFNQDKMIQIYDYLYQKLKVDNICISLVRGQPRESQAKNIDLEKYWQAHQHIRKTARFKHYTKLISYLITKKEDFMVDCFVETYKDKKMRIPCLAGKKTVILMANGDLYPCELLPLKLGNIKEAGYDFRKIWFSKKANEIRKKIRDSKCFCTQECIYTPNVFLNPFIWPKFLAYLVKKSK